MAAMMSPTCSWEISFPPLDEADLEYCETLEQEEHSGDFFIIKIHVKHQCITNPETNITFDESESESSMFLPSHILMEHGISDLDIPSQYIQTVTSNVTREANIMLQDCTIPSDHYYQSPTLRLFNLVLDITVQRLFDAEESGDEDAITDMIMRVSMGDQVRMVPASKTAIESLKKVKVEEGFAATMVEGCSICLAEFDDGTEVLSMPCKHVFHQDCLVQWLNTSHTCPFCRYIMSTSVDE